MSNPENNMEEVSEQKTRKPVSAIFLIIVIILAVCGYFYYKTKLPQQLMNMGRKNLEVKEYDKALNIFRYVGDRRPHDSAPIYYQVLTLSKMPPSYGTMEKLYEISQYEEFDEAADLADKVLANMRMQIDKQAGANYIDNVLFEDSLIRWKNPSALTYSIEADAPMPSAFPYIAEKAFKEWQRASNGEFSFKKTSENPNIAVHVVYSIPDDNVYTAKNASSVTVPDLNGTVLNKMDVYVKAADIRESAASADKVYGLMLHEIGHALGLGGHSVLPEDVMYYDGDKAGSLTMKKSISKRDLNTLNLLYKMIPDAADDKFSDSEKANMIYHDVVTAYPGENFEIETQRLLQELKTDKRNLPKWVDLSINYAFKRQYRRANYILERVLPLAAYNETNQFVIYYNMAVNYYKLKEYAYASRYLVLAEEINKDKDTRKLDAYIDVKEKRITAARRKLKELRLEYPKDIDISIKLAEIYNREKNYKEARRVMEDLVKANPDALRDRRVIKYKI